MKTRTKKKNTHSAAAVPAAETAADAAVESVEVPRRQPRLASIPFLKIFVPPESLAPALTGDENGAAVPAGKPLDVARSNSPARRCAPLRRRQRAAGTPQCSMVHRPPHGKRRF
jgi:hypothetical protein